jgi:hypothetical protein
MKIIADNRNLLLGLIFTIASVVGMTVAANMYHVRLAGVYAGDRFLDVSLNEVTAYRGLFPGRTLEQWLGPHQARVAAKQLSRYRGTLAATLAGGFLAVFFLGLHLDALRADSSAECTRH